MLRAAKSAPASRFSPRRPLLSGRWAPTLDALGVLIGFGCILYALAQIHPMIALGALGSTLAGSGAYGIFKRSKARSGDRFFPE